MLHAVASFLSRRPLRTIAVTSMSFCLATVGCDKEDTKNDTLALSPVHKITTNGIGVNIASDGNLMAISSANLGIEIFDTTNAERPLPIGSIELPKVYRVLLKGTTVFGFDEEFGLNQVDLRYLDQLQLRPTLTTAELFGFVNDAVWVNTTLFFASEGAGLAQYKDTYGPQLVGKNSTNAVFSDQGVKHLAHLPGLVVTAAARGEISVLQWEDGLTPVPQNTLKTNHPISDLACLSETCYTAGLSKGIHFYRTALNAVPEELAAVRTQNTVEKLHIDENLLFVSYLGLRADNGFYVYSVNGNDIQLARTVGTGSKVKDFKTVGAMLYVLLENGELQIFKRETLQ
jgi:hypothetical protein